jgi:diketogulonate reductase-like aldo/keto reductase
MYRLGARGIERDLIPFCERESIAVVGYTPFGDFPARNTGVLSEIGARHGKTPRQVVLRFLTRAQGVFAIPKASHPEHVRENAGAAGFTLTLAEVAEIEAAFPAPRRRVPLAMG